jgi:hypothetical protein
VLERPDDRLDPLPQPVGKTPGSGRRCVPGGAGTGPARRTTPRWSGRTGPCR